MTGSQQEKWRLKIKVQKAIIGVIFEEIILRNDFEFCIRPENENLLFFILEGSRLNF